MCNMFYGGAFCFTAKEHDYQFLKEKMCDLRVESREEKREREGEEEEECHFDKLERENNQEKMQKSTVSGNTDIKTMKRHLHIV